MIKCIQIKKTCDLCGSEAIHEWYFYDNKTKKYNYTKLCYEHSNMLKKQIENWLNNYNITVGDPEYKYCFRIDDGDNKIDTNSRFGSSKIRLDVTRENYSEIKQQIRMFCKNGWYNVWR